MVLEGQCTLNTLPDVPHEYDVCEKATTALKSHFQPRVNMVSTNFDRGNKIMVSSCIDSNVAFRELAKTCSFETCTDNQKIRLLLENYLTLREIFLELARSMESDVCESKVLINSVGVYRNRVIVHSKLKPREKAYDRCVSKCHLGNNSQCKGRCSKCSKTYHFQIFFPEFGTI